MVISTSPRNLARTDRGKDLRLRHGALVEDTLGDVTDVILARAETHIVFLTIAARDVHIVLVAVLSALGEVGEFAGHADGGEEDGDEVGLEGKHVG